MFEEALLRLELERSVVRPWSGEDLDALVRHANNRRVWINLYDVFPHPYTEQDAREWIGRASAADPLTNFAIEVGGEAAGGVGVEPGRLNARRNGTIGYWLGEALWGRGIISEIVPAMTRWSIERFDLCRVQAGVFAWNPASAHVLAKSGYAFEGTKRRAVVKDGQLVDEHLYAFVVEE